MIFTHQFEQVDLSWVHWNSGKIVASFQSLEVFFASLAIARNIGPSEVCAKKIYNADKVSWHVQYAYILTL